MYGTLVGERQRKKTRCCGITHTEKGDVRLHEVSHEIIIIAADANQRYLDLQEPVNLAFSSHGES